MPDDPQSDPFAPPEISTEVCCIHCGETYDSWQIEWRMLKNPDGKEQGFWCCPMPGCDGMGFGFDILPTDPTYQDERGGWVYDDVDEDEEWDEDEDDFDPSLLEADDVPGPLDEFSPDFTADPSSPEEPSKEARGPGEDWPFSMN